MGILEKQKKDRQIKKIIIILEILFNSGLLIFKVKIYPLASPYNKGPFPTVYIIRLYIWSFFITVKLKIKISISPNPY